MGNSITRQRTGGLTAEQLTDTARVTVSYDRAGRVARTSLGANASITAAYDVHGWVNARRFDYSGGTFTETMLYADGATPRFNGFISSRIWDGNRYDYTYDAMGRLVGARYSGTPGRNFTCAYEYDPRGNIQRLMRKGITGRLPSGVETFGDLDIITVTHSGNRPVGFTNEGDNPATFEGRTGAGIHEQAELSYDDAGRVTADTSRGIRRIDYNHRGQPVTIIFDDGHKHTMTYDGRGNLLKTIFYEAVGQVVAGKPTRYRVTAVRGYSGDGQVTEGDSLVMMRFAGGYFDGRGRACYYMPDYQGNNLGVVDADGHLTQRTDYYPYGEAWRQPEADVNPWLYSDKELLSVDGQHEYDYGARRYTPGFPMFTTPDPLSEVRPWHSPYLFCGANPVMNTDPTGMMYFYNLNGESINIDDPNPDDHGIYLLLTYSNYKIDIEVIYALSFIANEYYIPLPSVQVMSQMKECISKTMEDNCEHGFGVSRENEMTPIYNGTENGLNYIPDINTVYDVHTHPNLKRALDDWSINESSADIENCNNKLPGVVLSKYSEDTDESIGETSKESQCKWSISFYNKTGVKFFQAIEFSEFENIVNKIWGIEKGN